MLTDHETRPDHEAPRDGETPRASAPTHDAQLAAQNENGFPTREEPPRPGGGLGRGMARRGPARPRHEQLAAQTENESPALEEPSWLDDDLDEDMEPPRDSAFRGIWIGVAAAAAPPALLLPVPPPPRAPAPSRPGRPGRPRAGPVGTWPARRRPSRSSRP